MEAHLLEASHKPFRSIMSLAKTTSQPKKQLATNVFGSSVTQCDLELIKTHLLEASDHPLRGIMSLASMPS